jgi:hypothetical protein
LMQRLNDKDILTIFVPTKNRFLDAVNVCDRHLCNKGRLR